MKGREGGQEPADGTSAARWPLVAGQLGHVFRWRCQVLALDAGESRLCLPAAKLQVELVPIQDCIGSKHINTIGRDDEGCWLASLTRGF